MEPILIGLTLLAGAAGLALLGHFMNKHEREKAEAVWAKEPNVSTPPSKRPSPSNPNP